MGLSWQKTAILQKGDEWLGEKMITYGPRRKKRVNYGDLEILGMYIT
jgi:hypothetical protein